MKKILLLLLLSLSFNSYGEWTRVDIDSEKTIYIDINTIIEKDEFIYWWFMVDSNLGDWSVKIYAQGDCLIPRSKLLTTLYYNQPMGLGESDNETPDNPLWEYHPPDTWKGVLLGNVCKLVSSSSSKQEQILNEIYSSEELQKIRDTEELEAQAKIELALELDLKLLDLQILTQEKQQEIDSLEKLRTTFQQDDLLISLNELRAKIDEAKVEIEQLSIEKKLKDDALIAEANLILENLTNSIRQSYVNSIAAKVRYNWFFPGAEDDWTAEVYVVQDRDGNVRAVDVKNANVGNSKLAKSFMDSIERAVYKASPLPGAPDDAVFDRELYFVFSVN